VLQLKDDKIVAVEADRNVTASIGQRQFTLDAYAPVDAPR
jgi:hypothetical protein